VPVAAARLADVGAGDAQPLVLVRRRQHFLEQIAVTGLQLILLAQGAARLGDPIRQGVANPLQLFEIGDARLRGAGGDLGLEHDAWKGLGSQRGELVLEAPDLASQLRAREALVASNLKRGERVSFEQTRHKTRLQSKSRAGDVP
jgi:hypothetical protein